MIESLCVVSGLSPVAMSPDWTRRAASLAAHGDCSERAVYRIGVTCGCAWLTAPRPPVFQQAPRVVSPSYSSEAVSRARPDTPKPAEPLSAIAESVAGPFCRLQAPRRWHRSRTRVGSRESEIEVDLLARRRRAKIQVCVRSQFL